MHDIIDVIKNLQTLSENNSAFKVLKDFERVIDELDVYVFDNWEDGELVEGPHVFKVCTRSQRWQASCRLRLQSHLQKRRIANAKEDQRP
jgi:predicted component of viral defense system (DUF524 family)